MDTRSIATMARNRRIIWGGGVGLAVGLIGFPLVLMSVWPGVDHSPWSINTMVLAAGVTLCTLSYIGIRLAVSAFTDDRVSPPDNRPYLVAGGAAAIAVLCLVIAVMG
ncbi:MULTISPECIES: hypothetical protein [Actinosynnema]|uniref:Integral membrane protein n=1 Tax=Actinosynnema pretiosum TaxID=42197 RepID=A0A290ZE01_9PSEU|nr:hypothetical protein [Actinosynnema pretiosum]ATE57270.1 hypothetical protein CNX65_31525 [Actinosynnema pretiosum]